MSDSCRPDTRPAGTLRRPWDTFAGTCNIGPADTSFEHRYCLRLRQSTRRCGVVEVGARHTCADGLFKVLNCPVLGLVRVALLVMKPAELLEHLGVVR